MKRYFVTVTLLCFVLIGKGQNGKVKPVNFLKDIVSQFPNVRDIAFSPFGDEICFTVQSYMSELSAIVCVKKELEKFSIPKVASFSGRFNDLEPFFLLTVCACTLRLTGL